MKKIFNILAILAIAQFLALAGFVGTLASRGALTADRLKAAMSAMRGEVPDMPQASSQPSSQPAHFSPPAERIAQAGERVRIERMELDRRDREIADQWNMLRSSQMELLRDRERFEDDKRQWEEALVKRMEEQDRSGRLREQEIIEGLKPDQAKVLLRSKKDADVVELFMRMEPRTTRKIIGACKSEEELLWIGSILEQLRQRDIGQAEALAAGES
jgi:flagellar motility protein MotE (MotC chaperone)